RVTVTWVLISFSPIVGRGRAGPRQAAQAQGVRHRDQHPAPSRLAPHALVEQASLHVITTTRPPVMATRSAGARQKTAFGVPAAAQIASWRSRSSSMKVRTGRTWPTGATP